MMRALNASGPPDLDGAMHTTAELAGFFAAHAIWCVSDGEILVPMLAFDDPSAGRTLQRFVSDSYEEAVEQARERFEQNPDGAARGALFFDAFITLEWGKTDAIIIQARAYGEAPFTLEVAIPYRNASDADGFAVYRPKFLAVEGAAKHDLDHLGDLFFRGVDSHEKGAEIWNQSIDPTR